MWSGRPRVMAGHMRRRPPTHFAFRSFAPRRHLQSQGWTCSPSRRTPSRLGPYCAWLRGWRWPSVAPAAAAAAALVIRGRRRPEVTAAVSARVGNAKAPGLCTFTASLELESPTAAHHPPLSSHPCCLPRTRLVSLSLSILHRPLLIALPVFSALLARLAPFLSPPVVPGLRCHPSASHARPHPHGGNRRGNRHNGGDRGPSPPRAPTPPAWRWRHGCRAAPILPPRFGAHPRRCAGVHRDAIAQRRRCRAVGASKWGAPIRGRRHRVPTRAGRPAAPGLRRVCRSRPRRVRTRCARAATRLSQPV